MDLATDAVPDVAATEPMATPMMVPFTPNNEAMAAARTAPPAEAMSWRMENFMEWVGLAGWG